MKYIVKDNRVYNDRTEEIKSAYPHIAFGNAPLLEDVTEQFRASFDNLYNTVKNDLNQISQFENMIKQYQNEIDTRREKIARTLENSNIDKDIAKQLFPQQTAQMGL